MYSAPYVVAKVALTKVAVLIIVVIKAVVVVIEIVKVVLRHCTTSRQ